MRNLPEFDPYATMHHVCGYHGRLAMIALALVATVLPWIYFDGYDSAHSGADMLAFIVAGEGSEKWDMMKAAFLSAFTVLTFPIIITGLQILAAFMLYRSRVEPALHLAIVALICALLLTASNVTSNDRPQLGPFLLPGYGLAIVMLAHLAIPATLLLNRRQQVQDRAEVKRAEQYDWDPTV